MIYPLKELNLIEAIAGMIMNGQRVNFGTNISQAQFADAYIKAIAREYPRQTNNKILLPFRRIFMCGLNGPSAHV